MNCKILSIGTANPIHTMSQEQSLKLFTDIACQNSRQTRLAGVLFRKAEVETRYTAVPHQLAYDWCPTSEHATSSDASLNSGELATATLPASATMVQGPSTRERMEMYAQFASDLAVQSATKAIVRSELQASDITHLVTVTCTGFDAPGVDIELIRRLGLSHSTQRIQVGFMGCHAAINGMRTALAITRSDPSARVLLCAVELCSLHYRFSWDPEGIIGNALFADGSASLVLSHCDSKNSNSNYSDAPNQDSHNHPTCRTGLEIVATGSMLIPDSGDSMSWRIGDHGFEMRLTNEVGEKIEQHLAAWMHQWLAKYGLGLDDISFWGVHPGGPRILSAVETSLGLDRHALDTSKSILREFGNMSSPTVLFVLDRFLKQQTVSQETKPKHAILLGFGPGLVAEIALLST